MHLRAKGENALPLILTHGWPGSFAEFEAVAKLLMEPGAEPAFDLVIPSLPGFGFSSKPRAPGTGTRRTAEHWLALMDRLGYSRFGLQGGDLGAGVSTWIARLAPERVTGLHLNFLSGTFKPHLKNDDLTAEERQYLADVAAWSDSEGVYGRMHATHAETAAYGLADSPAGLAGWIVEKFRAWSDNDGDPASVLGRDAMLTDLSIY